MGKHVVFLMASLSASLAWAQAPARIGYQGKLLTSSGTPESGAHQLTFSIYDQGTGGSQLWSEAQTVTLNDGLYSVSLGDSVQFGASVFGTGDRFLEISVDGQALAPRQRINSVPYALACMNLQGGTVNATSMSVSGAVSVGGKPIIDSSGNWVGSAPAVSHGAGITGDGTSSHPLLVSYGKTAGTSVEGNDARMLNGEKVLVVRAQATTSASKSPRTLTLNGVAPFNNDSAGYHLAVIDRATHAVSTDPLLLRNFALANASEAIVLTGQLKALTSASIVVLVGKGPLANLDQKDGTTSLLDALISMGASSASLLSMGDGDSYFFVGIPGSGRGQAIERFGRGRDVRHTAVVIDGELVGANSAARTNYKYCFRSNLGDWSTTAGLPDQDINFTCELWTTGGDLELEYCLGVHENGGSSGGTYVKFTIDGAQQGNSWAPGFWDYNSPNDNMHTNNCGRVVIPGLSTGKHTAKMFVSLHECPGGCTYLLRYSHIMLREL